MMVLGLTGGVGAGKSRILELFSHDYGAQVIQQILWPGNWRIPDSRD